MAIKIIKPGKLKNPKDTRRFLCLNCGCVFDADRGDYEANDGQYSETVYWASCPTCRHSTWRSKPLEKEANNGN